MAEVYRCKVREVFDQLNGPAGNVEVTKAIRTPVDRIALTPSA
jgi:hypothetical protein